MSDPKQPTEPKLLVPRDEITSFAEALATAGVPVLMVADELLLSGYAMMAADQSADFTAGRLEQLAKHLRSGAAGAAPKLH
jgi:hypothetical protein